MDLPHGAIQFQSRSDLEILQVDSWPAPQRHQYYWLKLLNRWQNEEEKLVYLRALDVVKHRVDIHCLRVSLHDLLEDDIRAKLEDLLTTNDRYWSVAVYFDGYDPHVELTQALAMLRNVPYVTFPDLDELGAVTIRILDSLPHFQQLQYFDVRNNLFGVRDVEVLVSYPFAPKLYGLRIQPRQSLSLPLFSTKAIQNIQSMHLSPHSFSVTSASILVSTVTNMPNLKQLHVTMPHEDSSCDEDSSPRMEPFHSLFQWLQSPQCPVTNLTVEWEDRKHLPMVLAVIPKIPMLRSLCWFDFTWGQRSNLDAILAALLQAPHLETATMAGGVCDDLARKQILEFQLASRPRLFVFQLASGKNLQIGPRFDPIHQVSRWFQISQGFSRIQGKSSFPSSAWSHVLETLGNVTRREHLAVAPNVHAVQVDAQFTVVRELLGEPYRLDGMDHFQ